MELEIRRSERSAYEEQLLERLKSASANSVDDDFDNPAICAAFSAFRTNDHSEGLMALFSAFHGLYPRVSQHCSKRISFRVSTSNSIGC
jgi:hypothetical protein